MLHLAWRNAGLERAGVRGRDGHVYRIVYGGKPGGSLGPDFTDAVVERDDGTTFRGDVEIHVRESDWRAHGHHTDPRYNGVVLHVVAAESEGRPALRATGTSIPLLMLNWTGPAAPGKRPKGAKTGRRPPVNPAPGPLGRLDLAAAGLERFHAQAAGLALDIAAFGADQAIWLGVMGALGYPRNRRAFRALATRVAWDTAADCGGPDALEPLLVRAAGPSAVSGPLAGRISAPPGQGARPPGMKRLSGRAPQWVRPWGRPANSPAARIRAVSALVPGWAAQGGIANACSQVVANARGPADLATVFRPAELVADPLITVLGAARASEIVVNVLLPAVFALAAGRLTAPPGNTAPKDRVLVLYDSHPPLAVNSVTREARVALGVDYTVPKIRNARDQQGLIALYREMYRRGVRPRQPGLPGM